MADKPELGELRKGRDIGYKSGQTLMWYACVDCGKERWVELRGGKSVSQRCRSCASKGVRKNWKGGRIKDQYGYIWVKLYSGNFFYPMARSNNGYIREHRLVVAQHLSRLLSPKEIIHHKNGIKDDNRLSNLLLGSQSRHLTEHNKGYRDGYQQGYQDAQGGRIDDLLKHIRLLEWKIKEGVIR